MTGTQGFPATRAEALARLEAFLPHAGKYYAARRNLDLGPGRHIHVSRLSAALRLRLIGEEEVVRAACNAHGLQAAEKFVSEVFWRTYWKGWLESRPALWQSFLAEQAAILAHLDETPELKIRYQQAIRGETGIDCFDAWTRELRETGFLHNWARMQYASIWLFTLRLPLALGAGFTYRHFLDADPASNTLSWRWVAGLHSRGKAYLASPERIRAMTDSRFDPRGLATETGSLPLEPPTPAAPLRSVRTPDPALPSILLVTPEDLTSERLAHTPPIVAAVMLRPEAGSGPRAELMRQALDDTAARVEQHFGVPIVSAGPDGLASALRHTDARQIVTARVGVGETQDLLERLRPAIEASGMVLTEVQRAWDRESWPHCTRGYFALREKIPTLVARLLG